MLLLVFLATMRGYDAIRADLKFCGDALQFDEFHLSLTELKKNIDEENKTSRPLDSRVFRNSFTPHKATNESNKITKICS